MFPKDALSQAPATIDREQAAVGPNDNRYLPIDYEIRMGVRSGWIGPMLGIEIQPPVGMRNASGIRTACHAANIGLGTAHFGSTSTFFELDTHIGTLGSGQDVATPGLAAADIAASVIRQNEPLSSVVINNIVVMGETSLFENASPWAGESYPPGA